MGIIYKAGSLQHCVKAGRDVDIKMNVQRFSSLPLMDKEKEKAALPSLKC